MLWLLVLKDGIDFIMVLWIVGVEYCDVELMCVMMEVVKLVVVGFEVVCDW